MSLHGVAERNDAIRLPDKKSVHVGEHIVDDATMEVFEQHRDFWKDVLAEKYKRRVCATRGAERGKADDWRIRQRHDDVRPADPKPSRRAEPK